MNTLDVNYLIGKGSFRPVCYLIDQGLFDPADFVIDPNSGAKLAHYAAHHGNVKFMRYLHKWYKSNNKKTGKDNSVDIKDSYQCNIAHYAVR